MEKLRELKEVKRSRASQQYRVATRKTIPTANTNIYTYTYVRSLSCEDRCFIVESAAATAGTEAAAAAAVGVLF